LEVAARRRPDRADNRKPWEFPPARYGLPATWRRNVSIVTKIFVVLTTVLAILFVPLVVAFVNNAQSHKEDAKTQRGLKLRAQSAAEVAEFQLGQAQTTFSTALDKVEAEKTSLQNKINDLVSENNSQSLVIADQRDRLAGVQADLKEAIDSSKQAHKIITTLKDELKLRRDQAVKADKRITELTDQNQELETRMELAVANVRLLKEQLAAAEAQIVDLRSRVESRQGVVSASDDAQAPRPVPPVSIRGYVTDVQAIGETDVFVEISVGSNDQVAEGMNFIIHEGERYIGSLEVTKVDLNRSAGRVTLKEGEVRARQQVVASAR
jgi:hypothetical protein